MNIDLTGQNILLTGGSRGIGISICERLLESGARVAVVSRTQTEAIKALKSDRLLHVPADLSKNDEIEMAFNRVRHVWGDVHGLVNNAGIALSSDPEGDNQQWLEDWDQTLQVNLIATALFSKLFLAQKIPGRLVHISSRAAFRGDTPDYMAYAASKGGVVSLSRSIARGYGKEGVKSFVIAPGFVRTSMSQDFVDTYGEEFLTSDLSLDQLTEPSDVSPMVVFLLSGMADHATGCTIDINAGSYVH